MGQAASPKFKEYQQRVVANAQELASQLQDLGYTIGKKKCLKKWLNYFLNLNCSIYFFFLIMLQSLEEPTITLFW